MAGLTDEGFLPENFGTLREKIHADLRVEFGNSLPLDDSTIEGESWDILIERLAKLWELGEAVYASQDPDKATGASLDALCLLTGTTRQPPSYSAGPLLLTGDDATVIPGGSEARVDDDGNVCATDVTDGDAALALADVWVTLTAYAVGDIVSHDGNVYYALTDGTSGADGPTHTSRPVSIESPLVLEEGTITEDGDVTWVWVGEGDAYAEVDGVATELGPVSFPSFGVTDIVNSIAGWLGVGNPLDFDLGENTETDESLRESRRNNLSAPGTGTKDAIQSAIADVVDVVSVTVFVNNTMVEDADGVPPKSIEVLVRGGEDQDIFDALLANVAAGIGTFGNTEGTATDSQGTAQYVAFSRPTLVDIYVKVTLTYDATEYPDDGDDQVAQGVVDFGDLQDTGKDAVAQSIGATANALDIGVVEVTEVLISTAPAPTLSTTIPITLRQLAVFDTSRTEVVSTPVTP